MLFYTLDLETENEKNKVEEIYERYHRLMLKRAYDMLGEQMAAEDAVHDSFIKIVRSLKSIGEAESPKTKRLVMIILENTVFDMMRKRKRRGEEFVGDFETVHQEGYRVDESVEAELFLVNAIKSLPRLYRDVIILRYANGYEIGEIAEMLGISEGSVRTRIYRAKGLLTEICGEDDK